MAWLEGGEDIFVIELCAAAEPAKAVSAKLAVVIKDIVRLEGRKVDFIIFNIHRSASYASIA